TRTRTVVFSPACRVTTSALIPAAGTAPRGPSGLMISRSDGADPGSWGGGGGGGRSTRCVVRTAATGAGGVGSSVGVDRLNQTTAVTTAPSARSPSTAAAPPATTS